MRQSPGVDGNSVEDLSSMAHENWKLPQMPSGSCLVVWMVNHFAVLAMDRDADPPRPVLLDTMSRTPYLSGDLLTYQLPRLNGMSRLMWPEFCGDGVDVDLNFHVQQQPHALDRGEAQHLCGPLACALSYEVMINHLSVRDVRKIKFNPWRLRQWMYHCIVEKKLVQPPRL